MTDKLRAAAEMALEALEDAQEAYGNTSEWFRDRVEALRQALAEPDTGTDRGAWADVPDATKWVDQLRGDDEEPAFTDQGVKFTCGDCPQGGCCEVVEPPKPIGEIVEAHGLHGLICVSIPEMPPVGTKLYAEPPKREWAGLTNEEIADVMQGSVEGSNMLPYQFARVIEAKLKEKNNG